MVLASPIWLTHSKTLKGRAGEREQKNQGKEKGKKTEG